MSFSNADLIMKKGRLEAFSDGVIAIIITIMVLELEAPNGNNFKDLIPLAPVALSFLLSFIYLGIYWNNHHHMLHTAKYVNGKILWANLHLLFWLSLIPFVTAWIGKNHFSALPMAFYGLILLMSAISYSILQRQIIISHGTHSILSKAIGKDLKGKLSILLYFIAIVSTYFIQWIAAAIYIIVALIWLIPDQRIEVIIKENAKEIEKPNED